MKTVRSLAFLALSIGLLICGCSTSLTRNYPTEWEPIRQNSSGRACPDISGIYEDGGESPQCWPTYKWPCNSLGFYFNSEQVHTNRNEILLPSGFEDDFPRTQSHVQINQTGDDLLEIIALRRDGGPDYLVVDKTTLQRVNGDFSCDADGLKLRTRTAHLITGLANILRFEGRTFVNSGKGYLTMQSHRTGGGHFVIVPAAADDVIWVRWKRISRIKP